MSGTARQGIDAALIETDGEAFVRPVAFAHTPYTPATRELIVEASRIAVNTELRQTEPVITEADQIVTALHIEAAKQIIARTGMVSDQIDIIGSHGLTLVHRPDKGWSWQIGNGEMISDALQCLVASDFRAGAMRAGGQGAPVLPIFHQQLAAEMEKPAVILNLGGIASFTFVGFDGMLGAFDAGPGTALIDDWIFKHTGHRYDENGATAARGHINEMLLADMMKQAYFALAAPKSVDRSAFSATAVAFMDLADGAATLTAFVAQGIAGALRHLPTPPKRIYVTGGGRHNPVLMAMIAQSCGVPLEPIEAHGYNGDALEAQGIAYIAVRRMKLLPITFPGTTGVDSPISGGVLHHPRIGGLFG
jgi:anhydro-N-acetylmuramic acid kinase